MPGLRSQGEAEARQRVPAPAKIAPLPEGKTRRSSKQKIGIECSSTLSVSLVAGVVAEKEGVRRVCRNATVTFAFTLCLFPLTGGPFREPYEGYEMFFSN